MAEDMRICPLRAGFASIAESSRWVLHDPRAWLGIALHSLMQSAAHADATLNLENAWDKEVTRLASLAANHPFDRRFGDPTRWPSYYLVRQRTLSSARELISKRVRSNPHAPTIDTAEPTPAKIANRGIERKLVARSGRLIGRPDWFDRSAIKDFKSSLPDANAPKSPEILARHERQLKIYAAIIAEAVGFWPRTGILVGASGATISFELDPERCDAEAETALADLDEWNASLLAANSADELATPSESACGNCRYQLICPAFWDWVKKRPDVSMHGTSAAKGTLIAVQTGNDQDLHTLQFAKLVAVPIAEPDQALVVRSSIHGDHASKAIGAVCRVTGAAIRQDGRLRADLSTIIMPEDELPSIDIDHGPRCATLGDGACLASEPAK